MGGGDSFGSMLREERLSHIALKCTRCAALHGADMRTLRCRRCESLLEVEYRGDASCPQPAGWQGPAMPLPMHGSDAVVSLGEGDTPCVRLSSLGRALEPTVKNGGPSVTVLQTFEWVVCI